MPMDRSKYPLDWDAISARIRERDGQRCKWCGLPNGALIMRSLIDPARYVILKDDGIHYDQDGRAVRLSEMPEELDREKYTRVVLTVHHIGVDKPDGTPGDRHDKLDCRDENLAALCQRCHFKADWDIHFAAATAARIAKRHAGQRPLPGFAP
jgi:5-methylcytosine-specific restriction endonuclease McrA